MIQVYFLSVVTVIFAGLLASAEYLAAKSSAFAFLKALDSEGSIKKITGLLAAAVGVLKLFIVAPGETAVFVGDLLPALTGTALGLVHLAEAFPDNLQSETGWRRFLKGTLPYKTALGTTGIVVGVVHFILPAVLFL